MDKDANASFLNVNGLGGGEEGTGTTPLGKINGCAMKNGAAWWLALCWGVAVVHFQGPIHPPTCTRSQPNPYAGKQLVDEVLGKKTSTLGLTGGVQVRAYILGDKVPIPFPAKLLVSCPFVNHWGVSGDVQSECQTRLYPFWKKME